MEKPYFIKSDEIFPVPMYTTRARVQKIGEHALVERYDFASADELAGKISKEELARWTSKRQIFAIEHNGIKLYLLYGFDSADDFIPRPVIRQIIAALEIDTWHMAWWFWGLRCNRPIILSRT
jgi:hypothetical protein